MDAKYKDPTGSNEPVTISNASQLIGKTLLLNDYPEFKVTITGIVDTKFDKERYEVLKDNENWSITTSLLLQELQSIVNYGYHGALFTTADFINNFPQTDLVPIVQIPGNYSIQYYLETSQWQNSLTYVASLKDSLQSGILHFANANIQNGNIVLADNQIIATTNVLYNLYSSEISTISTLDIYEYYMASVFNSQIKNDFANLLVNNYGASQINAEDAATASNFAKSLYGQDINVGGTDIGVNVWGIPLPNNITGDGQLQQNISFQVLQANQPELFNNVYLSKSSNGSSGTAEQYEIVGLYTNSWDSAIIFSANKFNNLFPANEGDDIICAITTLSTDKNEAINLIKYSYETNSDVRFAMQSAVSSTLDQVNGMIETMSKIFLYIGIGFAVFAALMLMNFIAVSITQKKKEIGILRAIGARSSDVFKIFFSESFIITIINSILAIAATLTACILLNRMIRDQGTLISVLDFGIRQIVFVFAVGIATAIIASFLPVWKIARKKPVDAIKR